MKFHNLVIVSLLLSLIACSGDPKTGPVKVHYDRDACERCRMLISDRFHAAQVRGGKKNQVYKFDDIGGAVIWLAEQSWKDEAKTEIWVTSHLTADWINAQTAWYVQGKHTPMNYGYSAQLEKTTDAVDYTAMVKGIMDKFAMEQEGKYKHHE